MPRGSRITVPVLLAAVLGAAGCVVNEGEKVDLSGQDVLLTLLHTSDTHSRLFPYELEVGQVDETLGLLQDNGPFGGGARLAYLVKRERGRAGRSLWIDTGDPFQGAPIFNYFEGEVEFRVLSEIGVDVMTVGNHEFDRGGPNLAKQLDNWARFPALAANYRFEPSAYSANDLARLVKPYVVFNVRGLKVGVIGIGDTGSMFSIFETGNKLGITPLNVVDTTQQWVDFLRPQVDVIVVATHQGLSGDEYTIRHTEGIDVLLGGHLHIVLDPPKVIEDCQDEELQRERNCSPRRVILAHSGGFMKYLGRLDVVLRENPADPRNGFEVASHERVHAVPDRLDRSRGSRRGVLAGAVQDQDGAADQPRSADRLRAEHRAAFRGARRRLAAGQPRRRLDVAAQRHRDRLRADQHDGHPHRPQRGSGHHRGAVQRLPLR
jgi:5'-nucleotidase / UDP-sugar diphosphatase